MSKTQVIQKQITQPSTPPLDLAKLKTVKWISSFYGVQQTIKMSSVQYQRLQAITVLAWLFVPIEVSQV